MVTPKLTLREAMVTLTTMFPSFDEETIKGVLYQTNGHMERTIEVLLSMVDEGGDTTQPPPTLSTTTNVNNNTQPPPPSSERLRHTLDEDFLRYSNLDPATGAVQREEANDQFNQDEYYAQRLQQALFEQGLSNMPPQTHQQQQQHVYNEYDNSQQYQTNSTAQVRRNVDSGYSTRGIGSNNTTETSTFDQLSDLAKKKFADFKKKYFTNNNRNNTPPATDPEEATMNRGLLRDDDDDMENDRL